MEFKMTVLLITKSDDNESVSLVFNAIQKRGGQAFRFDTDRFPTEVKLVVRYEKGIEQLTLMNEQGELNLREVSAVWYRRIDIGGRIPQTLDRQLRNASVLESRVTIQGTIASLKAFHLDPVWTIRRAENKQLQLEVARELGIDIPRTLITNDPQAVQAFAESCPDGIITKMMSSFAIYDEKGQEKVVFTNPVSPEDLKHLDGLCLCPMTFQEQLLKTLELRVTIVGDRVFAAAIDSQSCEQSQYDWRRNGLELIDSWKFYQLPQELEKRLLQLMHWFGLHYGAIDMILTPDGRYVFLEVNPVGEFFWLEHCPGLPISGAIADLLLNHSPCRDYASQVAETTVSSFTSAV
jgi:MvdD family ATP-grasp ribosomal peptide maturase